MDGLLMSPADSTKGMIECPWCHKHNVAGVDVCSSCGHDLHDLPLMGKNADLVHSGLLSDPVSNLHYHEVSRLPAGSTIEEATKVMIESGHGSVILTDGGRTVGIFTERDLLYKVLGRGLSIQGTRVQDVMTRDVETVSPSDPVASALHKMALVGCRHLPVVEGEECLGIVSIRSIVEYFADKIPAK